MTHQLPTHLSASQLNTYIEDERRYYDKYVLGITDEATTSMSIGTAFENYLFDKEVDWSRLSTSANPRPDTIEKNKVKYTRTFEAMKKTVLAQGLIDAIAVSPEGVIYATSYTLQQEIAHPFENTTIKGYIDYIDSDKIVDIKTYSSDYQLHQMLEKYKRQLLTYGLAYPEHELYILAVQVDDYPQCRVYKISQDTRERETPVLLDMYKDLYMAKQTGLFAVEPKIEVIQEI
jgi:hypothetical protein